MCCYVASVGDKKEQLLGPTLEAQAQVAEWLSFRHSELLPLTEEALLRVDARLAGRTFLVGGALSLADLVLFDVVHRAMASLPAAQIGRMSSLVRWYDFLQHTADPRAIYPRVAVPMPPLRLPAPSAAVPRAEKAKAGVPMPATTSGAAPKAAEGGSAAPLAAEADSKRGKKEKKDKKDKPAASPKAEAELGVDALDIRVGRIVSVALHPNAESLYLEQIDLGEDQPRQVVSGLVKFVPIAKMENRRVVVVCNLKPAKMRDVMSYGMVLCASNAAHDQVDPVDPPEGAAIGERVTVEGYEGTPEPVLNPKRKVFEKLAPDLQTDAQGVANFKGVPFMTTAGPVIASIPNAHVA
ncbi:hypothetical protein WJX81_008473 [Elliptochloris bilobata]|uniref:tRNA-binding domain-containing protein n=1 Tax=Elliptochloris bilobata TaxID=381761 RepID=A0AAW1QIA5_9CHLO